MSIHDVWMEARFSLFVLTKHSPLFPRRRWEVAAKSVKFECLHSFLVHQGQIALTHKIVTGEKQDDVTRANALGSIFGVARIQHYDVSEDHVFLLAEVLLTTSHYVDNVHQDLWLFDGIWQLLEINFVIRNVLVCAAVCLKLSVNKVKCFIFPSLFLNWFLFEV